MSTRLLGSTRDALRHRAKHLYRRLPADRRVRGLGSFAHRRRLLLRKLVGGSWTVVVASPAGVRYPITADPVDELIAEDVAGRWHHAYFPDWPADVDPLPPSPTILDLGGHHGFFTVTALAEHPGSRVTVAEPNPASLACLRATIAHNGMSARVRVVPAGLGARRSTATLYTSPEGSWGDSLFEEDGATPGATVDLLPLADIVAGAPPDIVKCNAEGAEYQLIDQLAAEPWRPALLVVMVHPEFGDPESFEQQARALGYRLERDGPAGRPLYHLWRVTPGA